MSAPILDEHFRHTPLDARLAWFNPPDRWRCEASPPGLVVEPHGQTDFWQQTHYGFCADNGHFFGMELSGDFRLSTLVHFHPQHQYDQAGLMIRADASCWIKASVEHEPEGRPQLGAVVTNAGYSDWSLQDFPFPQNSVRLRITKQGPDVLIESAPPDLGRWTLMRVTRLACTAETPLRAGVYACCPKAAGFRAEFRWLCVESLGR